MEYKSFKWSYDHLNGNISGTTALYDSLADESSPTVEISGLPSDIIETKGPIKTFNWANSDDNETSDVTPAHMDTRLWIQAYPGGDEETFTDGDRFLFCGKTEHATGDNIVYFAIELLLQYLDMEWYVDILAILNSHQGHFSQNLNKTYQVRIIVNFLLVMQEQEHYMV